MTMNRTSIDSPALPAAMTTRLAPWMGRAVWLSSTLLGLALLTGCAALNQLNTEVTSFSQWPAARTPGSYAFERLPSQQARAEDQAVLEAAAASALTTAGFAPASNAGQADVLVQLGARISRVPGVWDDGYGWPHAAYGSAAPAWAWRVVPRVGYWGPRGGASIGLGWGWGDLPRYEREVAVVIRDRSTGKAIYETRAASEGGGGFTPKMLAALFEASLQGFPTPPSGPRPIQVMLPPSSAAAAAASAPASPATPAPSR